MFLFLAREGLKMEERDEKVIKALENPKYQWRTISGVSQEIKLPLGDVTASIIKNEDLIIESNIDSIDGEKLYTTRKHFRKKSTFWQKFSSVIRNRSS